MNRFWSSLANSIRLTTLSFLVITGLLVKPTQTSQTATQPICDLSNKLEVKSISPNVCIVNQTSLSEDSACDKSNTEKLPTLWKWNYAEEEIPDFRVLVREKSLDSRVANSLFAAFSLQVFSSDPHKVNLGDEETNRQYEAMAAGPDVDEVHCRLELERLLITIDELSNLMDAKRANLDQNYLEEKHIRLARMLDSFGRYQGGSLTGSQHYLGSPQQCTSTSLQLHPEKPSILTRTRYCVAKLNLETHLDPSLADSKAGMVTDLRHSVGICLPKSCHMTQLRQHMKYIEKLVGGQFQLPKHYFVHTELQVESVYCSPDEDSQLGRLSTFDWLMLIFAASWISLCAYMTFINVSPTSSVLSKRLQDSLSIRASIRDLLRVRTSDANVRCRLGSLDMMKVIASFLVIYGHSILLGMYMFNSNVLQTVKQSEKDPHLLSVIGSTMVVDSFFVLTGILITYTVMGRLNARRIAKINFTTKTYVQAPLLVIVFRYIRLVPLYACVFWLARILSSRIPSGAIRDDGLNMDTVAGACRLEKWYSPFTGMSMNLDLHKRCIPQAWSVANDMLFSFLVTPIAALMYRKPRTGIAIALAVAILSNIAMYLETLSMKPELAVVAGQLKLYGILSAFVNTNYIYTSAKFRFSSILVGTVSGLALHHYSETRRIKDWPKWMKGWATKISIASMFLSVALPLVLVILRGDHFDFKSSKHSLQVYAFATVTARLIWSLSNAVVLLRLMTDWKDSAFCIYGRLPVWTRLSRLSYGLLLVHIQIEAQSYMAVRGIAPYSLYSAVILAFTSYFVSLVISTFLYILVENPVRKLLESFIFMLLSIPNRKEKDKPTRE